MKEKKAYALFCRPKSNTYKEFIAAAEDSYFITKKISVEWNFVHAFHTEQAANNWIPMRTEYLWEIRAVIATERHANDWWAAVCGNIFPLKGDVHDHRREG